MKLKKLQEAGDPVKMEALRNKFLEQAKKYFGVPYARKYWRPEGLFESFCYKLFLFLRIYFYFIWFSSIYLLIY